MVQWGNGMMLRALVIGGEEEGERGMGVKGSKCFGRFREVLKSNSFEFCNRLASEYVSSSKR